MIRPKQLSGYFLIEALVTIVIFSLGLMGLINLYGKLYARSYDAQYRVLASQSAQEMLSMIIADNTHANCYTLPIPGACASTTAAEFRTTWLANIQNVLPDAANNAPTVAIDSSRRITITILWQRPQDPFLHNHIVVGQL